MPTENRLPNGQQIPNLNPSDNNQLEFPTAILDANGNGAIPGNLQINGSLNINGSASVGSLTSYNTILEGSVSALGNATFGSIVVNSGLTVGGATSSFQAASINETLSVAGASTLGNTQINGTLNTTGNTTLANTSGNTVKTFHNTLDDGTGQIITYNTTNSNISVTALPSTYDTYKCFSISNLNAINGITFSSTDPRVCQIGLGPNGAFIRCQNALDLTNNSVVLLPTHIAQFTTNGNWTVPTGVTMIYVSGCGGGAGATEYIPGGAGESAIKKAIAVTPGHVLAITIGAGGTGNTNVNTTVNPGGNTTIVDSTTTTTLLTLTGGISGAATSGTGISIFGISGPFGQGGQGGGSSTSAGGNGVGYGSGGGQGYSATGGNGANGVIFLEW